MFIDTVQDAIAFFSDLLDKEPTISTEGSVPFDAPHNDFKIYRWTVYYLTIRTYVDDSIDHNIKNVMIVKLVSIN